MKKVAMTRASVVAARPFKMHEKEKDDHTHNSSGLNRIYKQTDYGS
jgi:hypothetical protein